MFTKSPICPHCGGTVPKDAAFCPSCGQRLAGGVRRCGVCGTENRGDAKYCGACGQPLGVAAAPDVFRHRWIRPEADFAVRIETDDMPGLLKRGIKVEPGTNTLIIHRGANLGTMPPGEYTLGTIGQRVKDWLTGDIPERVTALLVDVTPVDLEFRLEDRFTKDPLPVGLTLRLQVEVGEPGVFLVNMLKGRERLTKEDVRAYISPEIIQVADRWLRRHTLQALVDDPSEPPRLELAIEEALRTTFAQAGLRLLQVRTVELNLQPFEAITGKYSQANLLDADLLAEMRLAETALRQAEQKARIDAEQALKLEEVRQEYEARKEQLQLEARRRRAALIQDTNLVELAEETAKVEREERMAALYERMRQAVLSDKMKEVRSEADFERFLSEIDHEKLLREKEHQDLLQTWREQGQDHERARAHLLTKLEIERDYELRVAQLTLQTGLDRQQGAADLEKMDVQQAKLSKEIEIARKRAYYEFELRQRTAEEALKLEREKDRLQTERDENELRLKRLKQQQDLEGIEAEGKLAVEILALMKANRRLDEEERLRMQREDELKRLWDKHKIELEKMEALERQKQAEREHDLRRIETMGRLGAEALISLSGVEQAQILADLKRSENLKGLSEEQILAMAAERSPEVAKALQVKYQNIAAGQAGEREQELYERLLAEQKESLRQLQAESEKSRHEVSDAWERSSQRALESADRAMDRLSDTAQAFAKGQGGQPQVIVVPGGSSPQVVYPTGATPAAGLDAADAATKLCPKCGRFVESEARHCPHCGNKFEGVA